MKKNLFFTILFLLLLTITGGLYYVLFSPNVQQDFQVKVEPKTDLNKLYRTIAPHLIFPKGFLLASKLKRFHKPVPGIYKIKKDMSNNALVNMFRSGRQVEIKVTFNNIADIPHLAGVFSRYLSPDSLDFLQAMLAEENLKQYGFNKETALLMYIPNTYRFYYHTSPEKVMQRMYSEYRRFWNEKRLAEARKLGLTPIQVGILASIIQKETTHAEELPVIAGVYLNRLKKGMLLQADPTVVYAYKRATGDTTIIKRVLLKHIAVDSPYNTYKYKGLPPGPIAMPDIQSIEAVLHARKHNFMYFVADPRRPGYHSFSHTLSEHNRKASQYRKFLNNQKIFQ